MVAGAVRKFVQKAMKGAGTKVPKLGTISSDIKKAEKKGDKATVKKLKRKKAKILKQKADISSKEKAKKDLAAKNKKTRSQKSLATEEGVKFGKNKTMVMAKDRPFGKDLDYQTGARGEAEIRGRPGGRAAVAQTARAGKINIGDDAVGFTNFLKMQESKTGLKRAKYKEKLNQILQSKDATKAQKELAQKRIDAMDAKGEADFARSIRKSAATRTGQKRADAKSRDPFFRALDEAKRDGVLGDDYEKLLPNQKKQVEQAAATFKRLKDRKDLPKDEARTKKKLAQRIMATDPRRGKAQGGMGLKMPTADQVGLKKLPTQVRNKMGYMYGGGMAKKPRMGSMDYRKGGLLLVAINMMKKGKKGK